MKITPQFSGNQSTHKNSTCSLANHRCIQSYLISVSAAGQRFKSGGTAAWSRSARVFVYCGHGRSKTIVIDRNIRKLYFRIKWACLWQRCWLITIEASRIEVDLRRGTGDVKYGTASCSKAGAEVFSSSFVAHHPYCWFHWLFYWIVRPTTKGT